MGIWGLFFQGILRCLSHSFYFQEPGSHCVAETMFSSFQLNQKNCFSQCEPWCCSELLAFLAFPQASRKYRVSAWGDDLGSKNTYDITMMTQVWSPRTHIRSQITAMHTYVTPALVEVDRETESKEIAGFAGHSRIVRTFKRARQTAIEQGK